jgi:hypothetical protein
MGTARKLNASDDHERGGSLKYTWTSGDGRYASDLSAMDEETETTRESERQRGREAEHWESNEKEQFVPTRNKRRIQTT